MSNKHTYASIKKSVEYIAEKSAKNLKDLEDYELMHTRETVIEDAKAGYRRTYNFDENRDVSSDELIQYYREMNIDDFEHVYCIDALAGKLLENKLKAFVEMKQIWYEVI